MAQTDPPSESESLPRPGTNPPRYFKAIAAMALNRVIGQGNKIPWHISEDFKWFKKMTTGCITVMGRKTFESIGKPLPNRINLILTRHPRKFVQAHPAVFGEFKEWRGGQELKRKDLNQLSFSRIEPAGSTTEIRIFNSLDRLHPSEFATQIFICGGAEIYRQALPMCSDLYLTVVKKEYPGDAFFPPFEDRFAEVAVLQDKDEFRILHYRNRALIES